jgi:hypothetical protein
LSLASFAAAFFTVFTGAAGDRRDGGSRKKATAGDSFTEGD